MEFWTYPPAYDPDYMPDPESRYWLPGRETMDAGDREAAIVARLRQVMAHAYAKAPFYRNKWDQAGIHPDQVRSLEDFERVPVVTKAELRQSQARAEPFGDYLCIDDSEVHHIHGTSGTTGRPTVFAIGRDDWQAIANSQARVMWGMGVRPGDIVFIASFFSLYMGSWGTLIGAERLRAKCFPFGAGVPGMTARSARWMALMKPKAFYATPSYALHLAEVAREEGIDPRDFGLELLFFSGEPGASVPGIRKRIEDAYGGRVIDCGSMAEMSPWMNVAGSAQTDGLLLWQDIVYTEVCDPTTHARVPYGEQGTPVYTHLERTSQPMIRLASGDLTHWVDEPNPCGRTYPRLPNGIYGRIDDMFTIRGENIYPSAIDSVLNEIAGYGGEHRVIISRDGAMDELLVRMEGAADVHTRGDEAVADLGTKAENELRTVLGVRARVEVVEPDVLERTEFKARRVIDDRDLFRSLQQRMEG